MLVWRDLPVDPQGAGVGATALSVMPSFAQLVLVAQDPQMTPYALERRAYVTRKRAEHETGTYFASLSTRTLVYKGMLTTGQLQPFFPDLSDERFASALALVHSRFSTNTFPSWPLAHPYRYIAHNGEINTVRGNRNWMRAREALLRGPHELPDDLSRLFPICTPGASDSASFDEVLELLHMGGRSLPHAVLMMVPEAWENAPDMDPDKRAFYEFHASLMEPWDGPACVTFTDGTQIGAVLDRNGLRPARWWQTVDGRVILASEVGVLDVPADQVVAKGRLQPGKMFLVDTAQGRIVERRRGQDRAGRRAPVRRLAAHRPARPARAARARARRLQPRVGAAPPAGLRLHRGGAADPAHPDGQGRRRGDRLDGHRHPGRRAVRAAAAAVRLLQPAVRAGHQPAAGRDPRGARHLPGRQHRPGAEPARAVRGVLPADRRCRSRCSPTTTSPRSSTSTRTATCRASRA